MAGGNMGNALQAKLKGDILSFLVKSGAVIYGGAPVAIDSTGYAVMAADTATHKFVGMAEEGNTAAEASGNGIVSVKVRRRGIFRMKFYNAGAQITDVGKLVGMHSVQGAAGGADYMVELFASTSNGVAVGVVVKYESVNYVWVDILPWAGFISASDLAAHLLVSDMTAHLVDGVAADMADDDATNTPLFVVADVRKRALTISHTTPTTCTLPAAAEMTDKDDGLIFTILKLGSGSDVVTFTAGAGTTINGASTYARAMAQYDSITFCYDRAASPVNYIVVARNTNQWCWTSSSATPAPTLSDCRQGLITVSHATPTVTLPTPAAGDAGLSFILMKTGTVGAVTVVPTGAETIDALASWATFLYVQYDSARFTWTGTLWKVSDLRLRARAVVAGTGEVTLAIMRAGRVEVGNAAAAALDLDTPNDTTDLYLAVMFTKTTAAGGGTAITLTTHGSETIDGGANDGADMDALYDSKTLTWFGATLGWITTSNHIH